MKLHKNGNLVQVVVNGTKYNISNKKNNTPQVVPVTSVSLDKTNINLISGNAEQLTVTVLPTNATDKTVKWSSSNKTVADVSDTGVVTAFGVGSCTIAVTSNGFGAVCDITVTSANISVTGISLNSTSGSLSIGQSRKLLVSVYPSDATNKNVTWSISNSKVASIDDTGVVTALAEGSATITVTAKDESLGKFSATYDLTVIAESSAVKTYSLDVPDSTTAYDDIKIALDDVVEMEIGEDLGMVAHLLPHTYERTNPFNLTTSNKNIVDVEGMVLTAVAEGSATITATTLDGKYSDSITVNVVQPFIFSATESETYYIEPSRFKLVEDDMTEDAAFTNNNAIRAIYRYAKDKGYKKVVFPTKKYYYIDGTDGIYSVSNLIIDLNGSTLQQIPTLAHIVRTFNISENKKDFNVCPRGYEGLSQSMLNKAYKSYWKNELGVWVSEYTNFYSRYTYAIKYGAGQVGTVYMNDSIPVISNYSIDDTNQYRDFIEKNKTYYMIFRYAKFIEYPADINLYSANTIRVFAELYKSDVKVSEKELGNKSWSKADGKRDINELTATFSITEDCDSVKIRVEGLSDAGQPISVFLEDLWISLDKTVNKNIENFVFENGSILSDALFADIYGVEYKKNLFLDAYGMDWRSIAKTEDSVSVSITHGEYIGLRNMTVGNSPGFNIGIGNGIADTSTYVNANQFELGALDDDGNKIDKSLYARMTAPIKINKGTSKYFRITDPTFTSTYYLGWRSRIVDIYCYDSSLKLIKILKGKFRHATLTMPEGTEYISLTVPMIDGEVIPTTGLADYNNSHFTIRYIYSTHKCFIDNCTIANNYSCGIAHSGVGVTVSNSNFYNNTGRMPWADIDSEDGWCMMQNNVFKNNTFGSYYGVIMCSGTNYVFKNNTFNAPLKIWNDCQYYKIVGNTFNNVGYPGNNGLGSTADMYVCDNVMNNITVNTTITHPTAEYKVYLIGNEFNSTYMSLTDANTVVSNLKLSGEIELKSYSRYLMRNLTQAILENVTALNLTTGYTFDNCDFGAKTIRLKQSTSSVFNNCIFLALPTNYSGTTIGTSIYNNCTITNAKTTTYYTYNNCTFINGVINDYVINGMVTDNMAFSQVNAVGTYYGMQQDCIKNASDWSVVALAKKSTNYACNLITVDSKLILSSAAGKNSVTVQIWRTNDGGVTTSRLMWTQTSSTDVIGDYEQFVVAFTYSASTKTYKCYINSKLIYTYAIPTGYVQAPISTSDIKIGSTTLYYYLYSKTLSDTEITQNFNAINTIIPEPIIYGTPVLSSSTLSLNEGECYDLSVKLSRQPSFNQNVTVAYSNTNIDLDKLSLTFTPENYNVEQIIKVKTFKDKFSRSNKKSTVKVDTTNATTQSVSVTINNTEAAFETPIETTIKSLYPQCTNFRGN